ncbi:MAG: type II secretion system protein GspD [Candidatus Omnitrophica bacterium]|nr:type II secretion system protein GspD [Candidatus Omnitrophota bacterium]
MKKGARFFVYLVVIFLTMFYCLSFVFAKEVLPATTLEEDPGQEEPLREEKISLDLRGVEITELFKILSRKSDLNIIPSAQVKGRVNIFLNNITVEDAIEVILVSQNLAVEKKRDVLYVMTAAEYQQTFGKKYHERRKLKIFKLAAADPQAVFNVFGQIKSDIGKIIIDPPSGTVIVIDIPPVISDMERALARLEQLQPQEIFELNYAKVEEVQGEISKVLTAGTGMLQLDKRTNKLVISDLPEKMRLIKNVITAFDEPTRQVFIEAEIIQVSLTDKYEYGINWERVFDEERLHNLTLGSKFYGSFPLDPTSTGWWAASGEEKDESAAVRAYNQVKKGKISIGTLATDHYNVVMQFLQTVGKTNVLSRPRIAVLNNEEAKILIGKRDAYTTSTITGETEGGLQAESVEFIDVGVQLSVTPTITNDDFIIMRVKPEVSAVLEYFESKIGSRIPILETSKAETVVKVKSGSMIMIGGLIRKEKVTSSLGLPFLSKIPFLGLLFGSKYKNFRKTELVIFLRPRLITGESTRFAKDEHLEEALTLKRPLKGFLH